MIWSRVIAGGVYLCVMLDERGSKGWCAKQIANYKDRTSAHQWNRLLTAELNEISNIDSGVTLNKLRSDEWLLGCFGQSFDPFGL